MNEKWLAIGSAGTAFIASLCCLGPLLLGGLGVGALLVATFAPLRPYFLTASAVLLALGFYFVYRTPRDAAACEGEVCATDSPARRVARPLLWLATVAVLALALFPYYGGKLVPPTRAAAPAASAALETIELKIEGMDCEACAGVIRNKLLETPGVATAEVHYPAGHAVVRHDPQRVDANALLAAVKSAGYRATLAEGN
ncbi:MAG: heavy-metal-associated domain-containing protein [Candidatus Acidiferrales bacterium]